MEDQEDKKNKRIVVEEIETPERQTSETTTSIPAAKEEHTHLRPIQPIKEHEPKTKEPESTSLLKLGILSFFSGMILGGAIVGGIFFFQSKVSNEAPQPTPTPEAPQPAPVEEIKEPVVEKIDATKYQINVLNGSGIAGEAGVVKALLELDKYKNIDTGNAKKFDFTDTQVAVKDGLPDGLYDMVRDRLKSKYTVIKADNPVDKTDDYDIIVTVGERK